MLALLAPGQGAQTPGMLTPWLELPEVADRLRRYAAAAGIDLVAAGTTADADTIRDTAIAQPLLVATGLATAAALFGGTDPARAVDVVAGHSVGELTAAALAGVLSDVDAVAVVAERGRAMAAAAGVTATGMTAILGGDLETVLAHLDRLGLTAANRNGAGQIVAAGTNEQLTALAADPPAGARLRPLPVAGAFHTRHMAPAVAALAAATATIPVDHPRTQLLSNADGAAVTDGADLIRRVVAQVAAPVRWDACLATLRALHVTAVIELAPGGTLAGIAKRELVGAEIVAIRTPDDLPAARAIVAAHARPSGPAPEIGPDWRLVVAPSSGTLHVDADRPTVLLPGATIGRVTSHRDAIDVAVADGGLVLEWLAEDGDPVTAGQPILRLDALSPGDLEVVRSNRRQITEKALDHAQKGAVG